MPNIGTSEILLILFIVVIVFGASRLPQIGEGFGKAIRNFKRGLSSEEDISIRHADKQLQDEIRAKRLAEKPHGAEIETLEDQSTKSRPGSS